MSTDPKSPRDRVVAQHGEKMASKADQLIMNTFCVAVASQIARDIKDALKGADMDREVGFALVVFDFGEAGTGSMAYASTAVRDDFLRLLDDLRGKLANTVANPPRAD